MYLLTCHSIIEARVVSLLYSAVTAPSPRKRKTHFLTEGCPPTYFSDVWSDFILLGQRNLLGWFLESSQCCLSIHLPTLTLVMWDESSAPVNLLWHLCVPYSVGPEPPEIPARQWAVSTRWDVGLQGSRHRDLEQTDATVAAAATAFVHKHLVLQGAGVRDLSPII